MSLAEKLVMVGLSDTGRQREQNEDRLFFDRGLGIAVVADGVGGHKAGEVASSMAVTLIPDALKPRLEKTENGDELPELLREILKQTHATILQVARSQPQYHGMGVALVMGLFFDNKVIVAHVGDSRMYRLRGGGLKRLTRDHTVLQQLIDQGMPPEEARNAVNPHLIYQAMGIQGEIQPDVNTYPAEPGDLYLLCSDGLTDMVEDGKIQEILEAPVKEEEERATRLVEAANAAGGRDNVTVLAIRVAAPFPVKKGWIQKIFR